MDILAQLLDFFIHLNTHLADILARYGTQTYIILFLIIFCETGLVVMPLLPGDSLLFAAGALLASTGKLNVYALVALLICAALTGDNLNYFIGKSFGGKIKAKEKIGFFKREYIDQTEAYFQKYGGRTVIIARFIPIIRTVAPFVAGTGNMHYLRYLLFCITGAVLWVGGLIALGFQFGNLEVVKNNFELVILSIVAVSMLPLFYQLGRNVFVKSS
jgi:membrane-associated protein